ncbi:endo alpha-1,4 polygalactosaminidase [Microbacterium sp. Root180]|uniref:endo alpha-1,4 polygalactosaminidase n=1 Tax=Microbacterium sp. Root180 TaxID=1736483 RepID=UPI0006F961F8|nr:endo alpha-1,4 polygalactosaminidase [Microbacterium sp. Root180]KRB38932.1 hypothetical protein ASD93_03085 [Microbacterium sp. Root180]
MGIGRGAASVVVVAMAALVLTACAHGDPAVTLPPEDAAPDYQLGEPYPPEPEVGIVVRDRTAAPAEGLYSICYVNGFQTQPGELDAWPDDLLLTDAAGDTVFDADWPDEALLDTSTDDNRAAIVEIVAPWIRECADAGYQGVEFDNLDTYARSDGALTFEQNAALAALLVDVAHDAGLAAGQKNAAEDAEALRAASGFDFAVVEECAQFEECEAYEDVYGDHVIAIEYDEATFRAACDEERMPESAVLRDRDLAAPGDPAYVFALCLDD